MDIEKLKVPELRAELANGGLDTKGTKPVLVARLKEHLGPQAFEASVTEEVMDGDEECQDDVGTEESSDTPAPATETATPAPVAKSEEAPEPMVVGNVPEETKPENAAVPAVAKDPETPAQPASTNGTGEGVTVAKATEAEGTAAVEGKQTSNENQQSAAKGVKRKRFVEEHYNVTEDEPEIPETFVCLDWSNSDLSLKIDKTTFLAAEPYFQEGWGYIWHGVRATHGFTTGKLHFEVKVAQFLDAKPSDEDKAKLNIHDIRIGWSHNKSPLILGESKFSFAFSSSGKKATNNIFEDYGESVTKDDVIGCSIDLDANPIKISFSKNGKSLGTAFEVSREDLNDQVFFPHIYTKNVKFEVNFGKNLAGADTEPWFAPEEGYKFVATDEGKQRGSPRIATRAECEIIMLVGLPGAGKTTWATKYVEEKAEKNYNLIGASSIYERMKVNGEPLRLHCHNWSNIVQKVTRCLNDWSRLASCRRRNYIVDQTNVFANAQRRRVRPFQGMIRKAVVIVPSEEDYKARIEAQDKSDAKELPDNSVMEMKANFALPYEPTEEGDKPLYDEVIYADLTKEESLKIVEAYNKEARDKGFGNKRFEGPPRKRMRGMPPKRGMPHSRGNMRGQPFGRFQRGGMPFRGMPNRGFMRGGPMGNPIRGGGFGRGGPFGGGQRGQNRGGSSGNFHRGSGGHNQRFQGGNKFQGGNNRGMGHHHQHHHHHPHPQQQQQVGNQWNSSPWQQNNMQRQPQQQRGNSWGGPWNSNNAPPSGVWNHGQGGNSSNWGHNNYNNQNNFSGPQSWGSGFNR